MLSAPGRYAFPDEDARWPYGLGRVERKLRWSKPDTVRSVRVEPDVQTWMRAMTKPIFVIVGSEDLEPQPVRPGHERAGTTPGELRARVDESDGRSRLDNRERGIESSSRSSKVSGTARGD